MTKGMTALYLLLTLGGGIAVFAAMASIQWVPGDEWRARGGKLYRSHPCGDRPGRILGVVQGARR